jgi:hypothetical protein
MTRSPVTSPVRTRSALLHGAKLLLALGVLSVALGLATGLAESPAGLVPYAWPILGLGVAALTAGLPLTAFAALEARLLRAERALQDSREALDAARQALDTARRTAETAQGLSTFRARARLGPGLLNAPIEGRARGHPLRPIFRR